MTLPLLADLLHDPAGLPAGYGFAPMAGWIRGLISRGHRVQVFTLDSSIDAVRRFDGEHLTVWAVPMRAQGRGKDMYRQERAALREVMEAADAEVLHAHWTYEFALAALATSKPVVVTAHDAPWAILPYFAGLNRAFIYRLSHHLMALQVAKKAPIITGVSPYISRHFRLFMNYRGPTLVTPNALPPEVVAYPVKSPGKIGPVVFAAVSRGWSAYKNVSTLLHAFAEVRRACPDARLLLFGEGYGPGEAAARYAQEHGLSGGVAFEGKTDYRALLDRLSAEVDVMVHPSVEESFGMSVIEAMALGLPMVAGERSGAVPWVTGGRDYASLVDVRRPDALARAMLDLAASPERRAQLGQAGAASVRQRFTLDRMLESYEAAYRQAISRAGGRPADLGAGAATPRLSVLLACHNRREKTVASLRHLLAAQAEVPDIDVRVILFDDGSTDGTAQAARAAYPGIEILPGDGLAFWNGGMSQAFDYAQQQDPDFYLWLNDDTFIYPHALVTLFETYRVAQHAEGDAVIVIGAVQDPNSGGMTYGARRRSGLSPMRLDAVLPDSPSLWADTFDGNCVLIPRAVVRRIGGLDPTFKHAMGDTDYGLRARQAGAAIRSTARFVGTCSANPSEGTWQDRSLPTRVRLKKLDGLKGLPRADWQRLLRRHGGPLWPLWMVAPRVRVVLQGLWRRKTGVPR